MKYTVLHNHALLFTIYLRYELCCVDLCLFDGTRLLISFKYVSSMVRLVS